MAWLTAQSRSRWRWVGVGLALLGAFLAIALRSGPAVGAEGDACAPVCVVLIQVDGLEPKDVTEASTPYLWRLAHPQVEGSPIPGSALDGRAGWIWQAPRSVVSTGTAPATASLLTGAFPEKTGIPADDFIGPGDGNSVARQRMGAGGFGDSPEPDAGQDVAQPIGPPHVESVLNLAANVTQVGVFLGDPGLAGVTAAKTQGTPRWYPPGHEADDSASLEAPQYTGDPRLCPIPRYPDGGAQLPGEQPAEDDYDPSRCPANDMTTANKAISDLKEDRFAGVGFTFMHLAELGAAKRLAGDADAAPVALPSGSTPPSVPEARSSMDQAIATFAEQYAQDDPAKWQKTVVMVVGAHGYQTTPVAKRVPYPGDATNPVRDLSDYVDEVHSMQLIPQGTMATIYGDAARLASVKADLEGKIDAACRERDPSLGSDGKCLKGIYYVNGSGRPASQTVAGKFKTWHLDALNSRGERTGASGDLVLLLERGWAFGRAAGLPRTADEEQPLTNPNTTSAGGPQERAVAALINGPSVAGSTGVAVRNLGTRGVKYYPVRTESWTPSDPDEQPPVDKQKCPDTTADPGENPGASPDPGGLTCANKPEEVVDDAEDSGHEAQPVTVDFAITISALLQLPFDPEQLQGRTLQEAFVTKLETGDESEPPFPPQCEDVAELTQSGAPVTVALVCDDEVDSPLTYRIASGPANGTLGPIVNGSVTYTPAAGFSGVDSFTYQAASAHGSSEPAIAFVTVAEPPIITRPPEFDFYGLARKLKARVVDSRGQTYARARRGSLLSTIRLEGEFGKPEAAVTLTFYRRVTVTTRPRRARPRRAPRSRRARPRRARVVRVVRLKPIARFDPFVVKRGHVKMSLKVPKLFRPTYVGLTVREIARTASGSRRRTGAQPCTKLRTRKKVPFRCMGPTRSAIVRIADANRLHKRKPKGRAAPKRKPGRRAAPRRRR